MLKKMLRTKENLLPLFVFLLSAAMVVVLIFSTAGKITDGDAAAELIFSRTLAKDGKLSLFSEDWFYSTELRVLHTQIIYALLFHIWDNFLFVRIAGALILCAILVISFFCFCKGMKLSNKAFFLGSAMLLLPTSVPYARIVLMHNYYLPYLANNFFALGLFGSLLRNPLEKRKPFIIKSIVLLLLCFLMGLGSIRQLITSIAPLFLSALMLYFMDSKNKGSNFSSTEEGKKGMAITLACTLFAGAGFIVSNFILKQYYSVGGIGTPAATIPALENIYLLFTFWLELCGFHPNFSVFSFSGMISILCVFVLIFYLYIGSKTVRLSYSTTPYLTRMAALLFPLLLLVNSVALLFSSYGTRQVMYQILPIAMAFPMMLAVENMKLKQNRFVRALIVFIIIVSLASGFVNTRYLANPVNNNITYSGFTFKNINIVKEITPAADFLIKNDLNLGYATYWNANILTEITNGKLSIAPLKAKEFAKYEWLTSKTLVNEAAHQENTFVLLTLAEQETFDIGWEYVESAQQVFIDDYYVIYTLTQMDFVDLLATFEK